MRGAVQRRANYHLVCHFSTCVCVFVCVVCVAKTPSRLGLASGVCVCMCVRRVCVRAIMPGLKQTNVCAPAPGTLCINEHTDTNTYYTHTATHTPLWNISSKTALLWRKQSFRMEYFWILCGGGGVRLRTLQNEHFIYIYRPVYTFFM